MQSADIQGLIDEAYALIAPYVEKDPTKFCTAEAFETGVQTLKTYCELRAQSVQGQLDGTVPSTSEAQKEDSAALIDASGITISDMGSMQNTMDGNPGFSGGPRGDGAGTQGEDASGQSGQSPDESFRPPDSAQTQPDTEDQADDQMQNRPDFAAGSPPQRPDEQTQDTSGQSLSSQWLLTGACALALLLAIGFAVWYRKR